MMLSQRSYATNYFMVGPQYEIETSSGKFFSTSQNGNIVNEKRNELLTNKRNFMLQQEQTSTFRDNV